MADPLSLALAAITLATALKDTIELAQKLSDSLKKPALNMREAESLAEETLEIVQDLKEFYAGHQSILDDAPDLRGAVTTLLKDMRSVYEECLPILDTTHRSKTKFHKIKYTITSWKNRKVVEMQIRSLKDQANKCYRRFTMLTQLGTAAGVMQLRGAMTSGPSTLHNSQHQSRVSDDKVLEFMGSTPVILSSLPPHVKLSERLVYRSYITLQVGKIYAIFKALASGGSYAIEEPDSSHLQPFRTVTWLKPSTEDELADVESNIFSLIANIQQSLKSKSNDLSIQRGAKAMSNLTVWLINLEMYQESSTIVLCAVDLYKTLSKINEDVYGPRLANALGHMSTCFEWTGNTVEAYKVITEAVTLARRLAATNPTREAQIQLAYLVKLSAYIGRSNGDLANAVKDAEEAVESYERMVGKAVIETKFGVMDKLGGPTTMTIEGTRIRDYAAALEELHYSLSSTERKDESMNAGIEALRLYGVIEQGHIGCSLISIAELCSSLASDKFQGLISDDQALSYVRRSVFQYEKMLQITGTVPTGLPSAHAAEAKLLSHLRRFDEAYAVCQKFERTVETYVDNQRLRAYSFLRLTQNLYDSFRLNEAALTGEQLLTTYRSLLSPLELCTAYRYTSWAFSEIEDHPKAIQIAEAAVNHWRTFSIQDTQYVSCLAEHLSNLAERLSGSQNYSRAFVEGHEALKLYSSLIKKRPGILNDYLHALRQNMSLAKKAEMEPKSCERSREVIEHCRILVNQFPAQQIFLIRCIRDHANLLGDFGHLADANTIIEEAFAWFDDQADSPQDSEWVVLHMDCLLYSARYLHDQGYLDKASTLCDKAIRIGQPFVGTYSIALNILRAQAHNLLALYNMGQISLARGKIQNCLNFASEHGLEGEGAYTWFLEMSSHIYRCSGGVDIALPTMRRSITIDREHSRNTTSWVLSGLLADAGEEEEALSVAREAVQELKKWKESHIHAQYTLALRLIYIHDFSQARELLVEARSFCEKQSQTINIWFIEVAITLQALGFLECASNRHEEGIATRNELNDLRKRLRLIFPSLADLVEVGLNRERNFAAWKNLCKKCELTCGHQDDAQPVEASIHSD